MNPEHAAVIAALKPAIEDLISRCTENPESFFPLQSVDEKLIHVVVELCRLPAAQFGQDLPAESPSSLAWSHGRRSMYDDPSYSESFPNIKEEQSRLVTIYIENICSRKSFFLITI